MLPRMKYEAFDAEFATFKASHPGASFADFYAHRVLTQIELGVRHATLGPTLKNSDDLTREQFVEICVDGGVTPETRLLDYGCGTLRTGRLFIRRLRRGHYMGMDVAQSLLDMGRELTGRQLLENRRATLHVIDEQGMARGIAFNADVVLSFGVAHHVHPDELAIYFRNLSRLAHKDGALIILTTTIGAGRSANMTWARPVDCYVKGLPGHDLRKITNMYDPITKRGVTYTRARLVFQRR